MLAAGITLRLKLAGWGGGTAATAAVAALLVLPAIAPAHAGSEAEGSAEPIRQQPKYKDLYQPGILTRWAFVEERTAVRSRPSEHGKKLGKLRLLTEDRTPELVLLLAKTILPDHDGRKWARIRSPIKPNNTLGWVPLEKLGGIRYSRTWLKIDRKRFRAKLIKEGKIVWRARIGVGKRKWPTPRGRFYIRNRLRPPPGTIYGSLAFGTNAHSDVLTDWPGGGVVGIHGTNQPELLPGRVSHGCVRIRNGKIRRLGRRMHLGTPVSIR